jgi:hypothetical protein
MNSVGRSHCQLIRSVSTSGKRPAEGGVGGGSVRRWSARGGRDEERARAGDTALRQGYL